MSRNAEAAEYAKEREREEAEYDRQRNDKMNRNARAAAEARKREEEEAANAAEEERIASFRNRNERAAAEEAERREAELEDDGDEDDVEDDEDDDEESDVEDLMDYEPLSSHAPPPPPPRLSVGDTACLTEDIEYEFGVVKAGTIVELKSHYFNAKEKREHWKGETLGCRSCDLILTISIPDALLVDYDEIHPPALDR